MKKTRILLKISAFLLIIGIIFTGADKILKVKYVDGIYSMQRFYELEENTVDVLFLGSSHAFETFNTSVLWDEYGIASYVLGGSVQPMWNTYFYLKEALKTQSPELIVLESYGCTFQENTSDYSRQIKNCYGMKFSVNKLNAMLTSSSYDNPNFFFPLSNYASRYQELTKADFLEAQGEPKFKDWMGFGSNHEHTVFSAAPDVAPTDEIQDMTQKTEKYYRKILQLAKEKQIAVAVVVNPYPGITKTDMLLYNSAEKIAEEYGVPFENFALHPAESGLDFRIHAADVFHLNAAGNQIYSEFFGSYLKNHFVIDDRRGDARYQSWERNSTYLKQTEFIIDLNHTFDFSEICRNIRSDNYSLFILTGSECPDTDELLKPLGMQNLESGKVYCFSHDERKIISQTPDITYQDIYLRFHDDLVYSDRKRLASQYTVDKHAVKIIIYDSITDDICDVFSVCGFDTQHVYR